MNRNTIVVSAPADTYSGYGARSRDLIRALINLDKYDVKILSQRWGNTRFGYLKDHKEKEISSRIIDKVEVQPDIWIQISVPNEFQKVGTYNIGVTAGMETTLVDQSWIEGCNRMDLILTSSTHSVNTFRQTTYEQREKSTNKVVKKIQLDVPIDIIFEGVDLSKYFNHGKAKLDLSEIKESFCYLLVGHWMQGDFGQDRKNVGYTIKSFLEAFKNKPNPPNAVLQAKKEPNVAMSAGANIAITTPSTILNTSPKPEPAGMGVIYTVSFITGKNISAISSSVSISKSFPCTISNPILSFCSIRAISSAKPSHCASISLKISRMLLSADTQSVPNFSPNSPINLTWVIYTHLLFWVRYYHIRYAHSLATLFVMLTWFTF